MKKQFKIVTMLSFGFAFTLLYFLTFAFSGTFKITGNLNPLHYQKESSVQLEEMVEEVKAPTYYTVFNVILNYLPLKK